jgi:hypothetical protein
MISVLGLAGIHIESATSFLGEILCGLVLDGVASGVRCFCRGSLGAARLAGRATLISTAHAPSHPEGSTPS